MQLAGQNDKFFLTPSGGRIAKAGLSPEKAQSYQQMLAQNMTPAAQPSPTDIWEQPAAMSIASPAQLDLAQQGLQPQQLASTQPMASAPLQIGEAVPGQMIPPPAAPGMAPSGQSAVAQDILKDYEQGIGMQQAAARKQANAITKMNQELEKESIALQRQQDIINYDLMREQERKDIAVAEAQTAYNTAAQDFAARKINPDRFFEGQPGKRLLAGIAIAFGGMGRALTGSANNTALQIINDAIEQDINAQRDDINIAKEGLSQKRQAIADLRTLFKDKEEAQLAQKAIAIDMAKQKVAEIGMRYGSVEAQAKADALIGQLEAGKSEALAKLFDLKQSKASASPALTDSQIKAVSDMASSYEKNDGIASYNKIDFAFQKMLNLAEIAQKNPNAAQAIITTFNRVLDENSVVREAEVNLTMQAGSVVDRFKQQAEKIATGTMTPQQVNNLVEAARQLQQAAAMGKAKVDRRFIERANAFGIPANLVISQTPAPTGSLKDELASLKVEDQGPEKSKRSTANVMPGR